MLMIEATGVHKSFQDQEILKGISLTVKAGEVVALIGPSGAGKSTFLRCLNQLEKIDKGRILIGGKTLVETDAQGVCQYAPEEEARQICLQTGMVFQQFNLFPHLTVLENLIEAPITVQKRKKEDVIPEALALLEKIGLSDKKDVHPARLSGGQQQRVAIARALAMKPEIMLFDEPTSSLDPELTGEVLAVIKELAQEHMTMLIVTHEMGFAKEVASQVSFMDTGRILASGPPDEMLINPREERIRAFLNKLITV